jgi:hypothetical protein
MARIMFMRAPSQPALSVASQSDSVTAPVFRSEHLAGRATGLEAPFDEVEAVHESRRQVTEALVEACVERIQPARALQAQADVAGLPSSIGVTSPG